MDSLREIFFKGFQLGPIQLVGWESMYVIVLVLLLSRILTTFLFQPIIAVLDQRKKLIGKVTGAQEETARILDAKAKEHGERLGAAWREASGTLEAAKQGAEVTRAAKLVDARAAAEHRVDDVKRRVAGEADKAQAELAGTSRELARKMASVLLGRELA